MTVNTKIYETYFEKIKDLQEIDYLKEKIVEITGRLKELNGENNFVDGRFERWFTEKQTLQKNLEDRIEAIKNLNGVIELFLNVIPIEDKVFICVPERNKRDEYTFSKSGNEFTVKHTDKYAQYEGYRPEIKKYSYTE